MSRIPGVTSTGSKRPDAVFGAHAGERGLPLRMVRSRGCQVEDDSGRAYVDYVMGLGAVALGYAHPEVTDAACEAVGDGVVGPLPPVLEEEVAETIAQHLPWIEQVRFLKTGAEAAAAAVRLARAHTGREFVLGCGYHGWLDWCQPHGTRGVPGAVSGDFAELPFNDMERAVELVRGMDARLAAVIIEPVIAAPPDPEWLRILRTETERTGAVLIFDEIKTIGRIALGGAVERWGVRPDLVVMGKAIGNGFPIAAVGGRADLMGAALHTWISSTLATEFVSLAACRATFGVLARERVPQHIGRVGNVLLDGFRRAAELHPALVKGAAGIPEMCFLQMRDDQASAAVAAGCARRGVLLKRTAYDFVSLAHDERIVAETLDVLDEVLRALARDPAGKR
ncbi:MAG TPA: aminotransferase class III-fold pyridoxal phosphate-dependent enzyme [Gemmatimonadales bacterium]|nr:aminotransferase class III-fold pyridoxal phosphate-dependent enzyme [Gemmatimonadales bacterium]